MLGSIDGSSPTLATDVAPPHRSCRPGRRLARGRRDRGRLRRAVGADPGRQAGRVRGVPRPAHRQGPGEGTGQPVRALHRPQAGPGAELHRPQVGRADARRRSQRHRLHRRRRLRRDPRQPAEERAEDARHALDRRRPQLEGLAARGRRAERHAGDDGPLHLRRPERLAT